MNGYFSEDIPLDYDGLCKASSHLKESYPFITCFSIGSSVLGRDIPAYVLGRGKSCVLYVGGVHALEYVTSMLLLKFTYELCENLESDSPLAGHDINRLLSSNSICIIPMLNPDGVEIHLKGAISAGANEDSVSKIACGNYCGWQANANGVDLNHNFDAGFEILHAEEQKSGIIGPSLRQYGGEQAESEPETKALCTLCRQKNFRTAFAFHSQGEEIYWKYGPKTPQSANKTAKLLASACGYSVAHPTGLAAHGGFKDWFIHSFSRPGFTVEVGRGVNPLPVSSLEEIYNKIFGLLSLGIFL